MMKQFSTSQVTYLIPSSLEGAIGPVKLSFYYILTALSTKILVSISIEFYAPKNWLIKYNKNCLHGPTDRKTTQKLYEKTKLSPI